MTATTGVAFAVLSHVVIDDVQTDSGEQVPAMLGGAGTYAAAGITMAGAGRAGIVSGIGKDFPPEDQDWLRRWDIDGSGLIPLGERTPRSLVRYLPDGERVETPQLGLEHFLTMRPHPSLLPHTWLPVTGLYVFQQAEPDYFQDLAAVRSAQTTVLWEISAESCRTELFDTVTELARTVDLFSLNLTEAQNLCGLQEPIDCVLRLQQAGVTQLSLRMGAAGSLVVDGDLVLHIEAAPVRLLVDPTGAGNCHSGALLAAWSASQSADQASRLASAAASFAIEQYGPPAQPVPHDQVLERAAHVKVTKID